MDFIPAYLGGRYIVFDCTMSSIDWLDVANCALTRIRSVNSVTDPESDYETIRVAVFKAAGIEKSRRLHL